jgi:AcrR family transcriptional regulator
MDPRTAATHARLQLAALDLFEQRGYHAVTVEDIAAAAGVSHMTFFRHFAAKDGVLLDDPFDPVIAEAVAAQSADLPAIERVGRGLLAAGESLGEEITETSRRGIAIVAGVPELRAGMAANSAATEQAIVDRAARPGREVETRIAAAACLAGITARLLEWAASGTSESLGELVAEAIHTVVPSLASTNDPWPAGAPDRVAGA